MSWPLLPIQVPMSSSLPVRVGRAGELDGEVFEDRYGPLAQRALEATLPLLSSCSAALRYRRRPQEPQYGVSCKWSRSCPGTSRPSSCADDGPFAEIRMETPRPRRASAAATSSRMKLRSSTDRRRDTPPLLQLADYISLVQGVPLPFHQRCRPQDVTTSVDTPF